jgi:hypothetical protein
MKQGHKLFCLASIFSCPPLLQKAWEGVFYFWVGTKELPNLSYQLRKLEMSETNTGTEFATLKINEIEVSVPRKFAPGMVLTENQATVLDAAYQRQFTNNQTAMAKARAERYTKDGKPEDAPLTATAIAALYTNYEPNVGGTRISNMDKIRQDAAWRMWAAMVAEHNHNVANGGKPVIVKAGSNQVTLPSGKGAAEKREALATSLLGLPAYADRIQAKIDEILAERGSKKDTAVATNAVVSGADLL